MKKWLIPYIIGMCMLAIWSGIVLHADTVITGDGVIITDILETSDDSTVVLTDDGITRIKEIAERGSIWDLKPKFYLPCRRANDVIDSLAVDMGVENLTGTKHDISYCTFTDGDDAYWFNGTSSFIDFGTNSVPDYMKTGNFTWSFWINCCDGSADKTIISFGGAHYNINQYNGNDDIHIRYRNASNVSESNTFYNCLDYDNWTHIVMTNNVVDGELETKLYKNGVYKGNSTDSDGWYATYSTRLYLGYYYSSVPNYFKGALSKIAFFDRVLTDNEVRKLYSYGTRDRTVKFYSTGMVEANAVEEAPSSEVTTWWVATAGSDVTGDGSAGNPFASVGHADTVATSGDFIMMMPGVYDKYEVLLNSGKPHAPITIEGIGTVIIDPSTPVSGFVADGTYAWKKPTADIGFTPSSMNIDNKILGGIYTYKLPDSLAVITDRPPNLTISREGIEGNWWDGVKALFAVYDGYLYFREENGAEPSTLGTVKIGAQDSSAFTLDNVSWTTIRNITIRNVYEGITLKGNTNHVVIDNVHTSSCYHGVNIDGNAYANTVKNCTMTFGYYGADTFGIFERGTTNDHFIHANTYTVMKYLFASGATDNVLIDVVTDGEGNLITGNYLYDGLQGINLNSPRCSATYNTVYNMSSLGICTGENVGMLNLGTRIVSDNIIANCNTNMRPHSVNRGASGRVDIYCRNRSWEPEGLGKHGFIHYQPVYDVDGWFDHPAAANVFADTLITADPQNVWIGTTYGTEVGSFGDLDTNGEWYYMDATPDTLFIYTDTADTSDVKRGLDDNTRSEVWFVQNSLSGGFAGIYMSAFQDDIDISLDKTYIINNIISAPNHLYPSTTGASHSDGFDVVANNWLRGTVNALWDDGNNISAGSAYFWPVGADISYIPSDWSVPADSSAYEAGVDLSHDNTWDSTLYDKLPAFSSGQYWTGTAPDMGAIP